MFYDSTASVVWQYGECFMIVGWRFIESTVIVVWQDFKYVMTVGWVFEDSTMSVVWEYAELCDSTVIIFGSILVLYGSRLNILWQ
jgi:hypothetical protein